MCELSASSVKRLIIRIRRNISIIICCSRCNAKPLCDKRTVRHICRDILEMERDISQIMEHTHERVS